MIFPASKEIEFEPESIIFSTLSVHAPCVVRLELQHEPTRKLLVVYQQMVAVASAQANCNMRSTNLLVVYNPDLIFTSCSSKRSGSFA